MKDTPLHSDEWRELENNAADIYRQLGFTVNQNVERSGKQVDIEATSKTPGVGSIKIMVECKFFAKKQTIPAPEVREFINDFRLLKDVHGYNKGILISNASLTTSGKSAIDACGSAQHMTLEGLEREALNVDTYLTSRISEFTEEFEQISHIPVDGEFTFASKPRDGRADKGPLLSLAMSWILSAESDRQLWILGEFGVGKTTSLKHLFCELGKKHLANNSEPIPVFLSLSRYANLSTPRDFFYVLAHSELHSALTAEWLERIYHQRRIILLLDGFDEMGEPSDAVGRRRNYFNLLLLAGSNSKTIITCRPSYFVNDSEFAKLKAMAIDESRFVPKESQRQDRINSELAKLLTELATEPLRETSSNSLNVGLSGTIDIRHKLSSVVNVKLFTIQQIKRFLKEKDARIVSLSHGKVDHESLFARIEETYDLEDLAQRPILLNMITLVLPKLIHDAKDGQIEVVIGKNSSEIREITPSVLYNVQVESELGREYDKKGVSRKIDPDAKRRVLEILSFTLLSEGGGSFERGRFLDLIRGCEPNGEFEEFETEIRSCSFLTRTNNSDIRFVHKSFIEFFAAFRILKLLSEFDLKKEKMALKNSFSEFEFPEGLAYFIGDLLSIFFTQFIGPVSELRFETDVSRICVTNAINCLNFSRQWIRRYAGISTGRLFLLKSHGSLEFKSAAIDGMHVKRSQFSDLTIAQSVFGELEFFACSFERFFSNETRIDRFVVKEHKGGVVKISNCNVQSFTGGGGLKILIQDSFFGFSDELIDPDLDVLVDRSVVRFPRHGALALIDAIFESSFLIGGDLPDRDPRVKFNRCVALGVHVRPGRDISEFAGMDGFLVLDVDELDKSSSTVEEAGFPLVLREGLIQKIRQDYRKALRAEFGESFADVSQGLRADFERSYMRDLSFQRRLVLNFGGQNLERLTVTEIFSKVQELRDI